MKDAEFKAKMTKIEKSYEIIIDELSKDPYSIPANKVPSYFEEPANPVAQISKSLNIEPLVEPVVH